MNRHPHPAGSDPGDEGSALVLALVFITTVALVIGSVLQFVTTDGLTTTQYTQQRDRANYVDAAVEGAINAIRLSPRDGLPTAAPYNGTPCPTYTAPAAAIGAPGTTGTAALAGTITVTCQGLTPAAGLGGGFTTSPQYAIESLGTAAGQGLNLSKNNTLAVQGSVGINGSLTFASGTPLINVLGDISVGGSCPSGGGITATGYVSIAGAASCTVQSGATAPSTTPTVSDPNFAAAGGSSAQLLSTADPVPTCLGSGSAAVVEFTPGLYSEAPSAPAACASAKVWWFSPGAANTDGYYYFDFPDTTTGTTSQWQLPAAAVIAGTPVNWTPGTTNTGAISPTSTTTYCDTSAAAAGVQFVIGGATQLALSDTSTNQLLEICSPHPSTQQQIALYALKTGTRTSATAQPTPGSAATPVGDQSFTPGTSAFPELATVNKGKTAGITWSGFDLSAIPAGSVISDVTLTVTHVSTAGITPTISVRAGQTQGMTTPPTSTTGGTCTSTTCTYDVTADLPATYRYEALKGWNGLAGLSVTYAAASKSDGETDSVAGLSLAIQYQSPALEGVHCAQQAIGACDPTSIDASSNKNSVIVHGTSYLPSAVLSIYGHNKAQQLFDRGVVVKSLNADVSASFKQPQALFTLPTANPAGRTVQFTATATVGGVAKTLLIAVVNYVDYQAAGGVLIADPGDSVTPTRWSVFR